MRYILLVSLSLYYMGCAHTLDSKLHHQFTLYELGQQKLLKINQDNQKPLKDRFLSQADWEVLINPQGSWKLTPKDLAELKFRQSQKIKQSKDLYQSQSIINLDQMRQLPPNESQLAIHQFCQNVPKGGLLHIHPWGTLSIETARKLLLKGNPQLPINEFIAEFSNPKGEAFLYKEELMFLSTLKDQIHYRSLTPKQQKEFLKLYELPPGAHPFERFESVFAFISKALNKKDENYFEAMNDFGQRAMSCGVSYIEFTQTADNQRLARAAKLAQYFKQKFNITLKVNHSFFRNESLAELATSTEDFLKTTPTKELVGIDILANEEGAPAIEKAQIPYMTILNQVRSGQSHLHRTMHAGELGDPHNPRDAIILGAERLGHGVQLINDPVALEYAIQKKIAIEANLTSNLKLRSVDHMDHHPFLSYLRLGLPVSLSTDDEGIFATDINKECELALSKTDISYAEYKQMAFNSLQTGFIEEDLKVELLSDLQNKYSYFEEMWIKRQKEP